MFRVIIGVAGVMTVAGGVSRGLRYVLLRFEGNERRRRRAEQRAVERVKTEKPWHDWKSWEDMK
jgi:hypothetical protein